MATIGDAAARVGLPVKTVRYYAGLGLVPTVRRNNGYREFDDRALHTLAFVARARALGFSLEECRVLVSLWQDRSRASADVRALASRKLEEIDARLADLAALRDTLEALVETCHGDDRPDCPILDDLAAGLPSHGVRS